jgi:hypothetical protein
MRRYRTASAFIIDLERYFVIPDDGRRIEEFLIAGRRISDEIMAQCPTAKAAELIAAALNREAKS